MIGFLRRLINPCQHKWTEVSRQAFADEFTKPGHFKYTLFILRCEHCGEMKKFKAKP